MRSLRALVIYSNSLNRKRKAFTPTDNFFQSCLVNERSKGLFQRVGCGSSKKDL